MALITDAYFGVISVAAGLLFVSVLCFPGWSPASPRESTCKEYYSVLKHLSSERTSSLSLSVTLNPVAPSSYCCLGNLDIVFVPFTHAVHVIIVIDWQRVWECNSPLWQIKDMQHKNFFYSSFTQSSFFKFPPEFLEDWNLAIFNAFPNICFLD